jgi:UDP:flavonoid glycosyltransferase YjiC (YdhE family)
MDLHEVFQNISLVVGYGSIGIATRAVMAGVPQLLVPTDVEKGMLAQRIHEQRLGIYLDLKRIPGEVDHAIELLLKTCAYRKTCQEAKRQSLGRLAAHSFEEALVSAAHRLEGTTSRTP